MGIELGDYAQDVGRQHVHLPFGYRPISAGSSKKDAIVVA